MRWSLYVLLLTGLLAACVSKTPPLRQSDIPLPEVAIEIPAAVEQEVPTDEITEEALVMDTRTRKLRFFALLRPLVQAENARILKLRQHLLALQKQAGAYSKDQLRDFRVWAQHYRVPLIGKPQSSFWAHLLKRVDVVPLELALAQAANESAWGTSRFSRQGNNFFGQWCFKKGCGLVPTRRNSSATHEVKVFASPDESVRAYIHNLNTTGVYRSLRGIRLHLRRAKQPLDAMLLASGLFAYSERGAAYVKSIRKIIRRNRALMLSAG
ncbi:MAG: glucosaminidase domain-containing protein [Mariprofundaceae bacterium]|nr:glucosaminidase domain-containing protein [Mariprofundaceae bacterium]